MKIRTLRSTDEGVAFLVRVGERTIYHGSEIESAASLSQVSYFPHKWTNNRMELMAVIAGLEALNRPCEVELYSDSQYVVNAFNRHWIDGWIKKGWAPRRNSASALR